ncbi:MULTISPECIES: YhcN/YlaJ family sporulation lipoprotein [Thermoactinomyces]|jgi:spore cortex protein|uniref:YhcN/YlaJ family sporulation lipoprotein n=1 Tax=Thermoactinomyces daqus TaxID=1329516 RepID=A0A7W2AJL8_9BACL|nr:MULTISPECIES: YhcN/YlaJ family sporulation lipoprotein [Thermoactinomyces]MBA4543914.1 YhcN/YlaJ family sporulation lipoprotein [Thermoactinomyces daqus]MBH8597428.1 YhcN/YlaJ family sporulation lipoprotein [Thermoactinomyces sp. CICC 10523]MBH8602989.1 YhcN/YlaJ family sporulation lipoprotein [Thermoactinomyces sp. CICC 10522]MBH8607163.1 YhcN/YlaJ family sporulation lipoprotein [Thermoactinomyces sp. CICC 10521]
MLTRRLFISGLVVLSMITMSVGCATSKQGLPNPNEPGYRTQKVANESLRNRNVRNDVRNGNTYLNRTDTNDNNLSRNVRVADDVARGVAGLKQVNTAAAIVMGRNAYVAVTLKHNTGDGKLTERIKKQIARRAKAVDPSLRNVYVSSNPNFVKQMNNYANDLRNGRPISGFIKNLGDMIRRTFPEAK